MSDLKLTWNEWGADATVEGHDLALEDGLATAVILSLYDETWQSTKFPRPFTYRNFHREPCRITSSPEVTSCFPAMISQNSSRIG